MKTNEFIVLLCAIRYAIGRHTYVVSAVTEYIKKKKLNKPEREKIITIIEESLGDIDNRNDEIAIIEKMDLDEWKSLIHFLKEKNSADK